MADRTIVYINEVPFDVDILLSQKNYLEAIAGYIDTVTGNTTYVNALNCIPSTPPALTVDLGAGQIYSLQQTDPTDYGSLSADLRLIMQQGILADAITVGTPAPITIGDSVKYLIEVAFQQLDGNQQNRTFLAAPSQLVDTQRQGLVSVITKAGVPAPTGTEVTPTPDAGYTGIWVITVAYGQTTVVSGDIVRYPGAPFILEKLQDKISNATASTIYLTIAQAAATYLTIVNAAATYLTIANAAATYLTIANAAATYLTIANAAATYVKLPPFGSAPYIFNVDKSADEIYGAGGSVIIFDSININIGTWYNAATGRITPTFPCSMLLTTSLEFNTTLGDATILMGITKNGGSFVDFSTLFLSSAFQTGADNVTTLIEFNGAGEFAEVVIVVGGVNVELLANSGTGAVFKGFVVVN